VNQRPSDLLLWVYLTGVSHGADMERRKADATAPSGGAEKG
jgi:hypothetical protein